MFGEYFVVTPGVSIERGDHGFIPRFCGVSENEQRVASKPSRIPVGEIPASMTLEELGIGGGQQLDGIDVGGAGSQDRRRRPGTCLLYTSDAADE